jgi:hypothetical protein
MRSLLLRLSSLDSDAEGAVRVISFFDALLERRASPSVVVATTARLAECPVGLDHAASGLRFRYGPDGRRLGAAPPPPHALVRPLAGEGRVWLERDEAPLPLDEMVLERLALTLALVLTDRRSTPLGLGDPALVGLVLGPDTPEPDRARGLTLLGLNPTALLTVVAVHGPDGAVKDLIARLSEAGPVHSARIGTVHALLSAGDDLPLTPLAGVRVGVAPRLPAAEAATAWQRALTALRCSGDTEPGDARPLLPFGRRVTRWDDLGGFGLVADSVDAADISDIADVVALDRLAGTAVGEATILTLEALCASGSVRGAATLLTLHHSTVAARIATAEQVLGFRLDSAGQVRLVMALALRRLRSGAQLLGGAR